MDTTNVEAREARLRTKTNAAWVIGTLGLVIAARWIAHGLPSVQREEALVDKSEKARAAGEEGGRAAIVTVPQIFEQARETPGSSRHYVFPLTDADKQIFDVLAKGGVRAGRFDDVLPNAPFRLQFGHVEKDGHVTTFSVDTTRKGTFDETWRIDERGLEKMRPGFQPGAPPVPERLVGGGWIPY